MTPLGFAQTLVDDLATLPLPPEFHAQLGDLVIPCAGTYLSVMNLTESPIAADPVCGTVQMADITVVAAYDCANVSNDDGTTNWAAQDTVSAQMDLAGDVLWEWAAKQRADAWVPTSAPSITYAIGGGVAMTTMGVQLPVP